MSSPLVATLTALEAAAHSFSIYYVFLGIPTINLVAVTRIERVTRGL